MLREIEQILDGNTEQIFWVLCWAEKKWLFKDIIFYDNADEQFSFEQEFEDGDEDLGDDFISWLDEWDL